MIKTDFLVIGSGIAGLTFALKASEIGSVAVVTKRGLSESATNYAQGGIAAVWSPEDSFEKHVKDTLIAGAGLCKRSIVEMVVREGPDRIRELIKLGVNFTLSSDSPENDYELGLEAGHSRRRILHAGDITGNEIEKILVKRAGKKQGVRIFEDHIAIDLITTGKIKKKFQRENDACRGAYVLNKKNGKVATFLADTVVLSTGGAGKVYLYTSNPDVSTGDGIAMAYRAGATVANMEFVQFHPTCLYHPLAKSFLISEALRGEGAVLRLKNGRKFMHMYDSRKELAPRDIVARAIDSELKKSGDDFVYLDITGRTRQFLKKRFPNIYRKTLEFGIDMATNPIPVVPAAHYFCGGILTNEFGETSLKRLFALGETACTGLHGANRLASNSLLEALVFSERAFRRVKEAALREPAPQRIPAWDAGTARDSDESVVVSQNWDEIRRFMWNYVGIVRSDKRLQRAIKRIELLQREISEYYWDFTVTSDLIELRNIATVAGIIVRSAKIRRESRGLHYNINHLKTLRKPSDTLINRFSVRTQ
ncbi:MAG: L-aspartate oxidase [Elusimicrobiota bacterium]